MLLGILKTPPSESRSSGEVRKLVEQNLGDKLNTMAMIVSELFGFHFKTRKISKYDQ